ncbi:hypothetical protein M501DRAFT_1011512 [Patellaria atrata CBS 101060]|uniref:Altered inheritance of mitochondria protein 9, mitochondrial n=1 Tax=Patellaria atrata CBS 101060 TaxID=1346257 RepID=A0A9P4SA00_9PEZI|nr:hypothetical protein M501DRAFT_1011512 [Patellaria atrata CBS 101060]
MSSSRKLTEDYRLFNYTNGRWLWNERQQLDARYQRFNVEKLGKVASEAIAFRLIMQDGQKVIAKIPNPNAGPAGYTTASEVVSLDFVKTILTLPAPKVLAWSTTKRNPVESEYIIMEEAKGSQLHKLWQKLELRAKRDIVREIVEVEKKVLSVSFDNGFADFGSAKATATSPELEEIIESRFSIGPIVRREFWAKERSDMSQYHGPWRSTDQYFESIARREIDWIKTYADPQKVITNPWLYTSDKQNCPDAHISSLRKFISAIPNIVSKDHDLVSPRLWHLDFHPGNIYMMMKLPDNFKQLDETVKDQLRYQVAQSILICSYETRTANENPLMHKMMRYPQGKTLKELEAFANATWDNCLEWDDFCSDRPCPYQFSIEELGQHQGESIAFNESQEFWASVGKIVSDEGYVSEEDFRKGIEIFQSLRESGLNTLSDKD